MVANGGRAGRGHLARHPDAAGNLITAPNLLREGRRHGFLEDVVSYPELRGRGHGKAVVQAALARAWTVGCHHVLMQSGRADPGVHGFYEALGVPARASHCIRRQPAGAAHQMMPPHDHGFVTGR